MGSHAPPRATAERGRSGGGLVLQDERARGGDELVAEDVELTGAAVLKLQAVLAGWVKRLSATC